MSEIRQSIVLSLSGNLQAQGRQIGRTFEGMNTTGSRALNALKSSVSAVGRGLDRLGNRYTALLTGAAGIGTVRSVMALEQRFVRLGIQADASGARIDALKRKVFEVAQAADVRVDPKGLADALDVIVEKLGDLPLAEENLRNIGLAMQAAGAEGADVGAMIADLQQKFGLRNAHDFLSTLDTLILQGKVGAFTLKNLATQGELVTAAYSLTGRRGPGAVREMGAILQMVRQTTGSAEEATTAFERLLSTMFQEKTKELTKAGIKLWDPEALAKGQKIARSVPDVIKEIVRKTRGDPEKLAQVFDLRAMRGIAAFALEFQQTGKFDNFDKFLKLQGNGSVLLADSARAAKTATAAVQSLRTAWGKFADAKLADPIQRLADALERMSSADIDRLLSRLTSGAAGLGAVILAAKGIGLAANVKSLITGGGAGGAGGLAGLAGAPLPVYVVNLPGSGLAAGGAAAAGATTRKALPWLAGGMAGLGTVAALAGAEGALVHQAVKHFDARRLDALPAGERASARQVLGIGGPAPEGRIRIEVDDARVRVKTVQSRGLDLDAGALGIWP